MYQYDVRVENCNVSCAISLDKGLELVNEKQYEHYDFDNSCRLYMLAYGNRKCIIQKYIVGILAKQNMRGKRTSSPDEIAVMAGNHEARKLFPFLKLMLIS